MIIHPVLATAEFILAQYDAAFLLMCEMVDELLLYNIHNYEKQLEELVAEKHN